MDVTIKDLFMMLIPVLAFFYATGRMSAGFATKQEVLTVKDETAKNLTALEKEQRAALEKKWTDSQQEHRTYATKSELAKIENDMSSDLKEMRSESKEGFAKMDKNYQNLLEALFGLTKQVTGTSKKGSQQDG